MPRAHVLSAVTEESWIKLKAENSIDSWFSERAKDIESKSLLNTTARDREKQLLSEAVDAVKNIPGPLFILGYWRSGTTHLHYLLAQDPQFAFITREDCFRPYRLAADAEIEPHIVSTRRKVDNLPIAPDMPGEDEFAIATRSLCSPYIGFAFPRSSERYDQYLSFESTGADEFKKWKEALLWTIKKATLWNPGRRLVLKSPPHMARVRSLLEIFPDAQFVYLKRDPEDCFRSLVQLVNTLGSGNVLQHDTPEAALTTMLRRYEIMVRAVEKDRHFVSLANFYECSYCDLKSHPMKLIEAIYRHLKIAGFEMACPKFTQYLQSQSGFVARTHPPVPSEVSTRAESIKRSAEEDLGTRDAVRPTPY